MVKKKKSQDNLKEFFENLRVSSLKAATDILSHFQFGKIKLDIKS